MFERTSLKFAKTTSSLYGSVLDLVNWFTLALKYNGGLNSWSITATVSPILTSLPSNSAFISYLIWGFDLSSRASLVSLNSSCGDSVSSLCTPNICEPFIFHCL